MVKEKYTGKHFGGTADSYGNEKLIRNWTRSVFSVFFQSYGYEKLIRNWTRPVFSVFFNLMGTRMVQIRIAKSV